MSGPAKTKDFFISYTGVDVNWAHWLARELEAEGYTTVYQARDFYEGGNFVAQMDEAMRTTKRTIAILSPEYLRSRFTLPEWAEAFRRDPTGEYALLVPVRVRACEVDGVLGARVYVDLVGVEEAAARIRLIDGVRGVAGKLLPTIVFPGAE